MNKLIADYVNSKVGYFVRDKMCCMQLFGPLLTFEHGIRLITENFGLKMKFHIINGQKVIQVYKSCCNHCIDYSESFQITRKSQIRILSLFKKLSKEFFLQDALPPNVFKPSYPKKMIPLKFNINEPRSYKHSVISETVHNSQRIFPFKKLILDKIQENVIVVINGEVGLEKSTTVPMFIVEEATGMNEYCKILCVESDNLSAITHCTVLTGQVNEQIGNRIGYQVHLQSHVCESTNLIYTTAVFFLRVLMSHENNLLHITHIIISDVHLHNAYKDILLQELKKILHLYPKIKLILLTNCIDNSKLLSYLGDVEEVKLETPLPAPKTYFREEIVSMIESYKTYANPTAADAIHATITMENMRLADQALDNYSKTGSEMYLSIFLDFVDYAKISINYKHSKSSLTILMIAAQQGQLTHIIRLMTYKEDFHDEGLSIAIKFAYESNHFECCKILSSLMQTNAKQMFVPQIDYELIENLLQMIINTWTSGNILIFLPTYEHLLRCKYKILKMQFLGKINQKAEIHLFDSIIDCQQLTRIISKSNFLKIVIATEFAETFQHLTDITYVIDSGLICKTKFISDTKCCQTKNEWASREILQRRSLIASRYKNGFCFRLMNEEMYNKFVLESPPELTYMPLDRILLYIKYLTSKEDLTKYFQGTIVQPPIEHITHSIDFLKSIEMLDNIGNVTWLGCRLIDVPIDFELGKSVILSILLKCFDPVLTIASFLSICDVKNLKMSKYYVAKEKILSKNDKNHSCSEDFYSDHLLFLRFYQTWQEDKRDKGNSILIDEETFVMDGILESVCETRTHLVGTLRSSQLIHNQGQHSMNSINLNANNWALVKATLVGGLHPKLCFINRSDKQLKSKSFQLCIHPSSLLYCSEIVKPHPSNWAVFFKEVNCTDRNVISNCSLINSTTIALFAGKTEFFPENVIFSSNFKSNSNYVQVFIDEWLSLLMEEKSFLLLHRLRQILNAIFIDFLQHCAVVEKWKKLNCETNFIIDLIATILLEEDINSGFMQPDKVGYLPKAITNKNKIYQQSLNMNTSLNDNVIRNHQQLEEINCNFPKEFFLINIFESNQKVKTFLKHSSIPVTEDSSFSCIYNQVSLEKLTYIVVCNLTQKRITNVSLIKCNGYPIILRNSFHVNIPIYDVIIMCNSFNLPIPAFKDECGPVKLDTNVGDIILGLL